MCPLHARRLLESVYSRFQNQSISLFRFGLKPSPNVKRFKPFGNRSKNRLQRSNHSGSFPNSNDPRSLKSVYSRLQKWNRSCPLESAQNRFLRRIVHILKIRKADSKSDIGGSGHIRYQFVSSRRAEIVYFRINLQPFLNRCSCCGFLGWSKNPRSHEQLVHNRFLD